MASITSTSVAAIFFLSLCLLSPNVSAHNKPKQENHDIKNHLVFQACKKTLFYDKCLSVYASNPKTNTCTTMSGIAKIAVEAAMKKVASTAFHINSLKQKSYSPFFTECISGCSKSYASVEKEMKVAMDELEKPNCKSAQVIMSLSDVMSQVSFCDKAFTMNKALSMDFSEKKVISADNLECLNLCSNAIAITKMLPS